MPRINRITQIFIALFVLFVKFVMTFWASANQILSENQAKNLQNTLHVLQKTLTCVAPSKAWRFLRGERPCRTRPNQPIVPSVAMMKENAKIG